jgi:hypothetical protein
MSWQVGVAQVGIVAAWVVAAWVVLWGAVLAAFARPLWRRWREPVLKFPVLAIESDDWGAGPTAQADDLDRIAACLARHRDATGRPALMTLGVVLEIPDGAAMTASAAGGEYVAVTLAAPRFAPVLAAMQSGIRDSVFAAHLHGQAHYWPPAVLRAAQDSDAVADWLRADEPATEALPSPLQSRWTDASQLPSLAIAPAALAAAARAEAAQFAQIFGAPPEVAVATTFVWNDTVEAAWAASGVAAVVTPGVRATRRDANGAPGGVDKTVLAGETGAGDVIYLVRDVYFEPATGHTSERLVAGLHARTRQARACWVETHRFNFLNARDASLAALDCALELALRAQPTLRFAAPAEIARAMRQRDPAWLETRFLPRWRALRARADEIPRYRRVARLTGLGALL